MRNTVGASNLTYKNDEVSLAGPDFSNVQIQLLLLLLLFFLLNHLMYYKN